MLQRAKRNSRFSPQEWLEHYGIPVPESGCWLFDGYIASHGYGMVLINKVMTRANRAAWMLFHGPIPDGMYVCHRCDVSSCINPKHLFLGTALDNMRDRDQKKRNFNANKTHCVRGHEFVPSPWRNARLCRECAREASHKYYLQGIARQA